MIDKLAAAEAAEERPWLIELLQDAVESGASVGFLPPLNSADAKELNVSEARSPSQP